MVSTRNTIFRSPKNNKNINKKSTKHSLNSKAKHKYNTEQKKLSRITDHMIRKEQRKEDQHKQLESTSNNENTVPDTMKAKRSKSKSTPQTDKYNVKKDDTDTRDITTLEKSDKELSTIKEGTEIEDISKNTEAHNQENNRKDLKTSDGDTELIPLPGKSQRMINEDREVEKTNEVVTGINNKDSKNKQIKNNDGNKELTSSSDKMNIMTINETVTEETSNEDTEGNNQQSISTQSNEDVRCTTSKSGKGHSATNEDRASEETTKEDTEGKNQELRAEQTRNNPEETVHPRNDTPEKTDRENTIDQETAYDLVQASTEYNKQEELEAGELQEGIQENFQDGESIASKKTLRNNNINIHSEDEDYVSRNGDQEFESEDDENTVDSSRSTQYNKKASNKQIPPRCIRYQIGIDITHTDIKILQREFEGKKEYKKIVLDVFSRIRDHLIELVKEIKYLDKQAKIISWKNKDTYDVLEGNAEDIPATASGLGQFFEGMRLKREQGRQYLRFRLHASKNANKLEAQISEWARLADYSFYRCVIQAEHSVSIGWLLYSSQYTNTQYLSNYLQRMTGFEWGFRIGSITKSDEHEDGKPVQWKNRMKALLVYVPTHKAEVAVTKISNFLQAKPTEENEVTQFYQRFLFIQPENTMVDVNSRLQYKHIINRQKAHLSAIKSKFILSVDIDIDTKVDTKVGQLSLRELILGIKTRQDGDIWEPFPLFHSIDFCPDSSKIWTGNSMGPGGPGHVITYYNAVESEALQMIRGLGVFLGKLYGYDNILECFTSDHWQSLEGWAFSKKKWRFITPESRQMSNNLQLDPNKMMVRMALQVKKEPETSEKSNNDTKKDKEKLRTLQSTTDESKTNQSEDDDDEKTDTSEIRKVFRTKELQLIKKNLDPDLDSLDNNMQSPEPPKLNNIILNDVSSTASSITTSTTDGNQPPLPHQLMNTTDNSVGSISTVSSLASITSSIHSITKDKLESLFEEGMTQQERKERADQYTYQQLRKVMIEKNKIYNTLFPEEKEDPEASKEEMKNEEHFTVTDSMTRDNSNGGQLVNVNPTDGVSDPKNKEIQKESILPNYNMVDLSETADDDPELLTPRSESSMSKDLLYHETVSIESADERK
jgi:hypothetical protein